MMRKTLTLVAAGLFVLAFAPRTEARTLTYNTVFSGNQPSGPSPYLTADITVAPSGNNEIATFTLTSSIDAGEFYTEIDFNVASGLSLTPSDWVLTYSDPDASTPDFAVGADAFKADGDGLYDLYFNFASGPPTARFGAGETITFTLLYQGTGTLTDQSFNVLSTPAGGAGPFTSAAHVQGIAPSCSGWIAPDNPNITETNSGPCSGTTTSPTTTSPTTPTSTNTTPTNTATPTGATPEPGLLTLLGTGLVMAGRRLRRQKTAA